jgi:Fe-S-cluster containining protein
VSIASVWTNYAYNGWIKLVHHRNNDMMELPADNSTPPWYEGGLRFACTQCGNCCTGSTGYVWVTEADLLAIAEFLQKPIGEIRLFHTRRAEGKVSLKEYPNGDCIYFDPQHRTCTIYPVRPIQCKTWPFWGKHLTTPEIWQQLKPNCPGINQGELYSLEHIQHQSTQTGF